MRVATMRAQGKLKPKAEEESGVGGLIGKFFKKK